MKKINVDEHKRIILEFLKTSFPTKKPVLKNTMRRHVYRCSNEGGTLEKAFSLAKKYDEIPGFNTLDASDPRFIEACHELDKASPIVFIGRNYITIDKNWQRAVKRLQAIDPERNWNMFEIEEFQGYSIVWD